MIVNNYRIKVHPLFKADFLSLIRDVQQLKEKLSKQDYLSHHKVKWLITIKTLMKDIIPKSPSHQDYFCSNSQSVLKNYSNIRRKKIQERYRLFFVFSTSPQEIGYVWFNGEDTLRKYGDKNDPYNVMLSYLKNGTIPKDSTEILKKCENYTEPMM